MSYCRDRHRRERDILSMPRREMLLFVIMGAFLLLIFWPVYLVKTLCCKLGSLIWSGKEVKDG
jgi:lauroyl/myristoyl acyltransferase